MRSKIFGGLAALVLALPLATPIWAEAPPEEALPPLAFYMQLLGWGGQEAGEGSGDAGSYIDPNGLTARPEAGEGSGDRGSYIDPDG